MLGEYVLAIIGEIKMKYKVETYTGWFIVEAKNKRQAYSEGVRDSGRGNVYCVTQATQSDIDYFILVKGEAAIEKIGNKYDSSY
jgi:hypothetical protein